LPRKKQEKAKRRKNKQNRLCSIESSLIAPPPKLPHLTLTASTCSDLIAASKQANLVASNYIPLPYSHHTQATYIQHTLTQQTPTVKLKKQNKADKLFSFLLFFFFFFFTKPSKVTGKK
jgi:hypothetical protein